MNSVVEIEESSASKPWAKPTNSSVQSDYHRRGEKMRGKSKRTWSSSRTTAWKRGMLVMAPTESGSTRGLPRGTDTTASCSGGSISAMAALARRRATGESGRKERTPPPPLPPTPLVLANLGQAVVRT